jgi:TRAP-type C4-dicarboxylate transport system permease small subunit
MNWLIKTEKVFTRILAGIISFCFLCIITLVITLVILRYGLNTTIIGANEFVVILFIYTSAIGAAIIIGEKEHIAINYFIDKLPVSIRKAVDINNLILIAFLNGVMIWYSIRWIRITGEYLTAVLRIQQAYAQIIIPVGCGIAIFYCINHIILILISNKEIR